MSFSNISDPGAGISSTSPNTSSNDPEPNQSKESLPHSGKYVKISNSNAQLKEWMYIPNPWCISIPKLTYMFHVVSKYSPMMTYITVHLLPKKNGPGFCDGKIFHTWSLSGIYQGISGAPVTPGARGTRSFRRTLLQRRRATPRWSWPFQLGLPPPALPFKGKHIIWLCLKIINPQ